MDNDAITWQEIKGLILPAIVIGVVFGGIVAFFPHSDMYQEEKDYRRSQVVEMIARDFWRMDHVTRDRLMEQYGISLDEVEPAANIERMLEGYSND